MMSFVKEKVDPPLDLAFLERDLPSQTRTIGDVDHLVCEWVAGLDVSYDHATAYRPDASPRENAWRHRYSRFFHVVHIDRAFESVKVERLFGVLWDLDLRVRKHARRTRETEVFLQQYFFSSRGLVEGTPASHALYDLYCAVLVDRPIAELCRDRKLYAFTRYGDQIVVSSRQQRSLSPKVRSEIRRILQRAGFKVNSARVRRHDDLRTKPICLAGKVFLQWRGVDEAAEIFLPTSSSSRLSQMVDTIIHILRRQNSTQDIRR